MLSSLLNPIPFGETKKPDVVAHANANANPPGLLYETNAGERSNGAPQLYLSATYSGNGALSFLPVPPTF